jgi:hypothetical protein
MNHKAIRKAYPQVVTIDDSIGAFDGEGNFVELNEVKIKEAEKEVIAEAKAATDAIEAKRIATLAKLAALGINEEEFKSLFV